MMHKKKREKLFGVALCLSLLAGLSASAKSVFTTTAIGLPAPFGAAGDGLIFPGSPFAGRQVLQVRLSWSVVVQAGSDAANIQAGVSLPTVGGPGALRSIDLSAATTGWSGFGLLTYDTTINPIDTTFGAVGTPWGFESFGLSPDAATVLSISRMEIDYLVPIAGDTDADDDIDDADLGAMFANYTGPVGAAGGRTTPQGDTDLDGDIDDADLGLAFAAYTGPIQPAVPEPASAALLVISGAVLLRRR